MEKRNVVEKGRTPEDKDMDKQAEAIERAAESIVERGVKDVVDHTEQ